MDRTFYITMSGINRLRLKAGMVEIRPAAGETIEAFKVRARIEIEQFYKDYPHLGGDFELVPESGKE